MNKKIILVGMMGCGKSTLARELSRRLEVPVRDTDTEIEKRCGVSIPEIFEFEGEEGFRKRETQTLAHTVVNEGVIATGGGIVTRPENREILQNSEAVVVYLKVSPEQAFQRTKFSNRPLLKNSDPLKTLRELTAVRHPLYQSVATIEIDTDGKNTEQVAEELLGLLGMPDGKENR